MSPQPLQISQLGSSEKLVSDDTDLIPIQQLNGVTRRISKANLLIPSTIKTAAEDGDYFIGIDSTGSLYKISKANLLAGLTSDSSSSGGDALFSSVSLLIHGSSPIADVTGKTVTNYGSTSVNTASKKFTSSIDFDGVNDYLSIPSTSAFNLQDDFTIEFWIKPGRLTGQALVNRLSSSNTFVIQMTSDGKVQAGIYTSSGFVGITSSTALELTLFQHVEYTRSGNNFYLFINGEVKGTTTSSSLPNTSTAPLLIGGEPGGTYLLQAKIEDLRITNSNRHTTAFTPPTSALPND